MIRLAIILLLWSAFSAAAQSDIYFLSCAANASVSFEGVTQAGRAVHRLEVRRLAYLAPLAKKEYVTSKSCVVYFAGEEHGPSLLHTMNDCIDPLVRKVADDVVEIFFLAGAHTHMRQRWKLLGHTAKLEDEREIDWRDDPRMDEYPNKARRP